MPRQKKPKPRGGVPGRHASPGSGTVFQASPHRWRAAFTWHNPETGTRTRIHLSAPTEAAAREAMAQRRRDLTAGLTPNEADLTLRDYLATWLRDVVRPTRSSRTLDIYVSHAARITAALGAVPLRELRRGQVQRFVSDLGQQRSPATVRLCFAVLRSALRHAVRLELITADPSSLITLPRPATPEVATLDAETIARILSVARATGDRLTALWEVLAMTGLRHGEALGLRWEDLDLDAGTLTVRGQLVRTRAGGLERAEPKTRMSRRTLDLPPPTVAALRDHRARMLREQLAAPAWPPLSYVFVSTAGTPYPQQTTGARWRALLVAAGVPHIHLHALRHTVATLMAAEGEPLKVIQERLGHASPAVTLAVYSHTTQTMHRHASERLMARFAAARAAVGTPVDPPGASEGAC